MIEVTGRRGRRREQLLDDINENREYWKLKEEAIDLKILRLLTVHLEICMPGNQPDALFIFSLLSQYNSTCFELASSPSSAGSNVYM
jgi:hypothetical protein